MHAALNGVEAPAFICESAGTGRQARLRGVCQPTWEFKSPLSHQNTQPILMTLEKIQCHQGFPGFFIPEIIFIFPLRTKGVFTQLRRLELLYAPFWGVIGPPLLPVLEKNIFYFRKIKYTKKFKCRIVDFAESIIRHFCFIAI